MLPPEAITAKRAPVRVAVLEQRRERRRARAFDEVVRVAVEMAHRRLHLVLRYADDPLGAGTDDLQRRGNGNAHRHAVGEGVRARGLDRLARFAGARVAVGLVGHHADDFRFQPERVAPGDEAADAGAAADRHVHRVEVRDRREQLEARSCRRRRPARDGTGRWNERPCSRASCAACSFASSKSRPCSISSAPQARIAAFLSRLLPCGTTITVRTPWRRPDQAMLWPWLPRVALITPGSFGSARLSASSMTMPPRILKAPVAVWFSCFTQISQPARALSSGQDSCGVGGITEWTRRTASSSASRVSLMAFP